MKLSLKITLLAVGIAFMALFSASIFGYLYGEAETRSHIDSFLQSEAKGIACALEGWLTEKASVIKVLESVIGEMDTPEQVDSKFLQHYRRDSDISDIYIGFEDGRFVSGIGWQPPVGYDPRSRPWYIQAKKADRLNFSTPYLDLTTGKYAVSVGIPVKDKAGRTVGILAEDILLETLTQRVQDIDLGGLGYGFLIDANGTGLSHPNPSYINADLRIHPDTKEIAEVILSHHDGLWDYMFKGTPKIMFHQTLPSTGWTLGVSVEKAVVYKPMERLKNLYLVSGLAIMLLVILISEIFSLQLTRRLSALIGESRKVAAGKYSFAVGPEGKDELSELARAFASMAQSLSVRVVERDEALKRLDKLNTELETTVEDRTAEVTAANQELLAINDELVTTLETLKTTQHQLVQSERLAALGGMVAGIAHEINTPVGIGVTCTSYLEREVGILEGKFKENRLRKQELSEFIVETKDALTTITKNLDRADRLIKSFKLVSADQTYDEKRIFNVNEYIQALVLSLNPLLKKTVHRFSYTCPDGLNIISYPAAFAQIITHFVTNSIQHGFAPEALGEMRLEVDFLDGILSLCFWDSGKGMEPAIRDRIFEPFYTTRRGKDGSMGLGLHVVYNIVTEQLFGTIACISEPGKGTRFEVRIPLES